jgi:hypothetical protein
MSDQTDRNNTPTTDNRTNLKRSSLKNTDGRSKVPAIVARELLTVALVVGATFVVVGNLVTRRKVES